MAIKESLQNANVWARRMQVELDQDELVTFLATRFPGSILRGPLIAVMCRYYRIRLVRHLCVSSQRPSPPKRW